ncbi:MAG: phytanoyl-CoA dioxygenase family protein [Acidimicrobiales bacterium]
MSGPVEARRTLADPDLDEALRTAGSVVVPLLAPAAARDLRDRWLRLHPSQRVEHHEGQPPDFEGDFSNPDLAFRQASAAAIRTIAGDAAGARFVRRRAAGHAMLVKWPTPPSAMDFDDVPAAFHVDTSFVDERGGDRSHLVWIALQDTTAEDGALQVVPGSHRIAPSLRGIDVMPDWIQHRAVFADAAVTVELRAGEALVFDTALVHRSTPNLGASPRLAATILMVPEEAPLRAMRLAPDGQIEVVAVPEAFFAEGQREDLGTLPVVDRVERPDGAMAADELARRLAALGAG